MTKTYTFYKITYKRHYFAFPILLALSVFFLAANIDNIYHQEKIIPNLLFSLFFIVCIFKFSIYFIRLLKVRRPYVRLSTENLEYEDIWNKKCTICFNKICKTELSSHSFQNNPCIDLKVYSWDYKLQTKSGFGQLKLVVKISISPTQFENLNLDFISLLSILKSQTIQQREQYLKQLNQDKAIILNEYMTPTQQQIYQEKKVILINNP